MTSLSLECIAFDTGPNPTTSVIWLHGLGADGNDFVPVASQLNLDGCPPIRFIFPHATQMPVTINGGYVMRAWYDILSNDLVRKEDETGVRASQAKINHLIEHEKRRGVPAKRIVLAGFSQGCAMVLQTGLRYGEQLGGLMCLSGYLPLADTLTGERSAANQNTPIFMAHGQYDPIVPLARATASRDMLTQLGHTIEWKTYPMEHSVAEEEIDDIGAWLRKVLAASPI